MAPSSGISPWNRPKEADSLSAPQRAQERDPTQAATESASMARAKAMAAISRWLEVLFFSRPAQGDRLGGPVP